AADGLVVTDPRLRIVSVNPMFSQISGYGLEDMLGHRPTFLQNDHFNRALYKSIREDLQQDGRWSGEVWDRRKNGEEFPVWLSISVLRDTQGRPRNYILSIADYTARKQAEETIQRQANFDALTNLPNRNLFQDRLNQSLGAARRSGGKVALMFIDLDRFKKVNDSYGHTAGDQVIIECADRIKACLRTTDTVARLGGDEFVVILPDIGRTQECRIVAEKILSSLAKPIRFGHIEVFNSGSIGIAIFPDDANDLENLIKNADTAMFEAKDQGRDGYHFFTEAMNQRIVTSVRVENELRRAIENDEFLLVYQPILDLSTQQVVRAEALIRWQPPGEGMRFPDQFIPIAEESGLILPIGDWVLRAAAQQLQEWIAKGYPDFGVAVNVSTRQFLEDSFTAKLDRVVVSTALPRQNLTLEITESLFLDARNEIAREVLALIKADGIKIAVDDFGTGYSSLSYLKHLPVHGLKIDKGFVRDILDSPEDEAMVKAIVSMAQSLNLTVTAEGVETEYHEAILRSIGCSHAQGYFYGKPMPPEELETMLSNPAAPPEQRTDVDLSV
ncbi:MAG: putative bifunctional diguanylate cyclase/phosphodiesterase, partial [Magnetospiraceae bacterium]